MKNFNFLFLCLCLIFCTQICNGQTNINCSDVAHAIRQIDSQNCECEPNYIWQQLQHKCFRNCSSVNYTLNFILQNKSQCICIQNFKWSASTEKCYLNCSTIPYTAAQSPLIADSAFRQYCKCEPHYYWDFASNLCIGISYDSPKVCPQTNFQLVDGKCLPSCHLDPNAAAINYQYPNSCICKPNFVWNSFHKLCVRNCSQIIGSNGLNLLNVSKCNCQPNMQWLDNGICFLNCSTIPYSVSNNTFEGSGLKLCLCSLNSMTPNYYWNPVQNKCKTCLTPNTTALRCGCQQAGYIYIIRTSMCIRNCPADPNAINHNSSAFDSCICKQGYVWNIYLYLCVKDCAKINFAGGLNLTNINECICQNNMQWLNGSCYMDCLTIPNGIGSANPEFNFIVSILAPQCTCALNYFWYSLFNFCVNCSLVPRVSSTQSSSQYNLCACQTNYFWDPFFSRCIKNCSTDPHALNMVRTFHSQCNCMANFTWDNKLDLCVRNCRYIENSPAFANPLNVSQCSCDPGYAWNVTTELCYLNCAQIYAATNNSGINSCYCRLGFIWDSFNLKCISYCSQIKYALKQNPLNQTSCICEPNYKWNSNGSCSIDCTIIPYVYYFGRNQTSSTIFPNIVGLDQSCFCDSWYHWNYDMNYCQSDTWIYSNGYYQMTAATGFKAEVDSVYTRDCINDTNAINTDTYYISAPYECNCKAGFIWNSTLSMCVKNCANIFYSLGLNQTNISSCSCLPNFYWHSINGQCYLNCSIPNADGSIGNIQYHYQFCQCSPNYYWDPSINQCVLCINLSGSCGCQNGNYSYQVTGYHFSSVNICIRNCDIDPNSNKAIKHRFTNICNCNYGYIWDLNKNQCVRDCKNINWATSLNNANINQCICQAPLVWSLQYNNCQLNCSAIQKAVGIAEPTFIGLQRKLQPRCVCPLNYFWDFTSKSCIDCPSMTYAAIAFESNGTINQCGCLPNYIWHPTFNLCAKNCSTDANSINLNTSFPTQCVCKYSYIWNNINNICVRNCQSDSFATTVSTTNVTKCGCITGFIWNNILGKCVRNCAIVDGANILDSANISKCVCLTNYVWNSNGTCNLNLTAIPNALNIVIGIVVRTFANCSIGYYWDYASNLCARCVVTANSTCKCADPKFFFYPTYKLCLRNCSSTIDPFASTSLNPYFPERCYCVSNYTWNITLKLCVRNCTNDPQALYLNSTNISRCVCKSGFGWDAINKYCSRGALSKSIQTQTNYLTQQDHKNYDLNKKQIVIIVLSVTFGLVLLMTTILLLKKFKSRTKKESQKKTESQKVQSIKTDSQKCINID